MRTSTLRVLLIEDDSADVLLAQELLSDTRTRVDLTVATTLAAACALFSAQTPAVFDCVLLDLDLPDATGLDGLRRLLRAGPVPAICVLTGFGDEQLGAAAVAEGAQDYLIKGQIDGVTLARSLRYAVERRRAEDNARRLREIELLQQQSARLERGLLPQPLLNTDAVHVHTFYRPGQRAAPLSGDFYDVVAPSPGRLAMMVGDVCGHGVDEAALGVELRVAWRALILAGVPDEAVLPAVEQVLVSERRSEEVFATLAMAFFDIEGSYVDIRLAGHPPPLLITSSQTTTLNVMHGPLLGVFDNAQRPVARTHVGPGQWALLMFTDGLMEGRTGDGDARFGLAGLCRLVDSGRASAIAAKDLPLWMVEQVEAANGAPLKDDVAMLLLCPGPAE